MAKMKYSIIIQWSEEDQVYVVTLPEWGGAHTHGSTYEEAARNAQEVLELLTKSDKKDEYLPAAHEFMYPGPSGFSYDLGRSLPIKTKVSAQRKKVRHATA